MHANQLGPDSKNKWPKIDDARKFKTTFKLYISPISFFYANSLKYNNNFNFLIHSNDFDGGRQKKEQLFLECIIFISSYSGRTRIISHLNCSFSPLNRNKLLGGWI